jgi:hypothetical protein
MGKLGCRLVEASGIHPHPLQSECTNLSRYKWVFLAKSHVPLRTHVDHVTGGRAARDGEIGGFGCLFCAAEGAPRGWLTAANINSSASIMSNSTGSSGGGSGNDKGTPVFGNVASFMAHLEMHRGEEGWPGAEMRGRMKCVVGKVASLAEEWEVNFVPVSGESGVDGGGGESGGRRIGQRE